jgi:hypothetical protein
MQDRWYGDNRDLVKWGTLLELARIYRAKQILQVLYYRPNTWDPIEVGGSLVRIPNEVIQHFRNSMSICKMKTSVPIKVLGKTIADRNQYLQYVIGEVQKRKTIKKIVFLDPDTGIEPQGPPGLQHVLEGELDAIWNSLSEQDVLVLYQHKTGMNNNDFIQPKLQQFVNAIGIEAARAKYAHAPTYNTANDVAFFYATKE